MAAERSGPRKSPRQDRSRATGERIVMPLNGDVWLQPGERLHSESCGGGGYGEPAKRDPAKVEHHLREGWISAEYVSENYGIKI